MSAFIAYTMSGAFFCLAIFLAAATVAMCMERDAKRYGAGPALVGICSVIVLTLIAWSFAALAEGKL